jgi:uncharacterized protein
MDVNNTLYLDAPITIMTLSCKLLPLTLFVVSGAAALSQTGTPDVCPRDDAAFLKVRQTAEAKDAAAETALASCYDLGLHVQPDGKESIRWLKEAASQGYAPAEYELGRIYLYGRGVPVDYAKAVQWERKAAEQGHARAQRDLAFIYERGFGVQPDPAQAAEWNRKAANQGHAEAQAHLARALDEGAGVQKNPVEAREWYVKAAGHDHPAAQLELARKLAEKPDCNGAAHWFEEAAAHGQTAAMLELGKLYLKSQCADRSRAFTWFTIGARFGLKESSEEAGKVQQMLSAEQRAHALHTAESWIKEHPGSEKEEN